MTGLCLYWSGGNHSLAAMLLPGLCAVCVTLLQHCHEREVTILLVQVQAIAQHELIRDVKAYII